MLQPPSWLQRVVDLTRPHVHPQIQVVLEAYAMARSDACPFEQPTLECGDCGTRVRLHESLTRPLVAEWWETVRVHHNRGHRDCDAIYRPHSRRRCCTAQERNGRSALPWILDGYHV